MFKGKNMTNIRRHLYYNCDLGLGGSIWKPPPMNPFTQGMPEELIEHDDKEPKKGTLSVT